MKHKNRQVRLKHQIWYKNFTLLSYYLLQNLDTPIIHLHETFVTADRLKSCKISPIQHSLFIITLFKRNRYFTKVR